MKAVFLQSSGWTLICQYAELASSLEKVVFKKSKRPGSKKLRKQKTKKQLPVESTDSENEQEQEPAVLERGKFLLPSESESSDSEFELPVKKSKKMSRKPKKHARRGKRSKKYKHSSESSDSSSSSEEEEKPRKLKKRKAKKTKKSRRHHDYYYTTDSSSSESEEDEGERRGNPRKLPKNLRFDGSTSWLSFKQKFNSFREVGNWTDSECRDYLNWSLEGKALDYFTYATEMGRNLTHKQIMKKLEGRFGVKDLTETSRVRFHQASQRPEESLEEWADRVLTLATPAFRDFSDERYCRQEAISKFCQGCVDKEAGKHACLERPRTMDRALNLVKHYQYITQAVDGKRGRKSEHTVNAVGSGASMDEDRFEKLLEAALTKMATMFSQGQVPKNHNLESATATGQNPRRKKYMQCHYCKKPGHFRSECQIRLRNEQKSLNSKGRGKMATPPSPQ